MNRITKCRLVGYTFLTIVTLVEIVMFCTMFHIDGDSIGKLAAAVITPIVFNISVWVLAILYYKVKNKQPPYSQ
jgi:amino acid permease